MIVFEFLVVHAFLICDPIIQISCNFIINDMCFGVTLLIIKDINVLIQALVMSIYPIMLFFISLHSHLKRLLTLFLQRKAPWNLWYLH